MSGLDWIALGLIALTGLIGFRKGLVASALAIVGVIAGAVIGARVAPLLLPGGSHSPYTPLVALAGAVIGRPSWRRSARWPARPFAPG